MVEREPFTQLVEVSNVMQSFGLLYPGEKQLLTFSFEPVLAEENALLTTQAPTVTVTCLWGNDTDASAICPNPGAVNAEPITIETPAGGTIILPALTAVRLPVVASQIPGAIYVIEVSVPTNIATIVPICAGRLQLWAAPTL